MSIPFASLTGHLWSQTATTSHWQKPGPFSSNEAQAWERILEQTKFIPGNSRRASSVDHENDHPHAPATTQNQKQVAAQRDTRDGDSLVPQSRLTPQNKIFAAASSSAAVRLEQLSPHGATPRAEAHTPLMHRIADNSAAAVNLTSMPIVVAGNASRMCHAFAYPNHNATSVIPHKGGNDVATLDVHVLRDGNALTIVIRGRAEDAAEALRTGLEAARHIRADAGQLDRIIFNGALVWQRTATHPGTSRDSFAFSC